MSVQESYEIWLSELRKTFAEPSLAQPVIDTGTFFYFLDSDSRKNGWKDITLSECKQVTVFLHEFGHTVTCICSSYDDDAEVLAVVADEPGPGKNRLGVAHMVIKDGKILEAHNQAIELAWKNFHSCGITC